jgi:hypothetical protein
MASLYRRRYDTFGVIAEASGTFESYTIQLFQSYELSSLPEPTGREQWPGIDFRRGGAPAILL